MAGDLQMRTRIRAGIDVERLAHEPLALAVAAETDQGPSQHPRRVGDIGVAFTKTFAFARERFAQQRFGAVGMAGIHQGPAEIRHRFGQRIAVVRQQVAGERECFLAGVDRLCRFADALVQTGDPGERLHLLDRAAIRPGLECRDGILQSRHRIARAAEFVEILRDQVLDMQCAPVRRAELHAGKRDRLLEHRLRAIGMAAAPFEIADERENLDAQFGLRGEIAIRALAPAREQLFGCLAGPGSGRSAVEQAF